MVKSFSFANKTLPPSLNQLKVLDTKAGRIFTSREAREFHRTVLKSYMGSELYKTLLNKPSTAPCHFEYFLCPNHTHTDLDNYGKCFLDGCQRAGIIKYDSQIQEITARKCQDCVNIKGVGQELVSVYVATIAH